ncbi:MAG: DUF1294 domain-containing protein [Chloroflexi bacterium]|nr:DUF1294 domain-containing protein [Chloroflexota bacterium]
MLPYLGDCRATRRVCTALFTYIFFIYFGLNLVTMAVFGWDKVAATVGRSRVRERTLFALIAVGGSLGGCIGMELFRHQTQKTKFLLMLVVIIVIQLAAIWCIQAVLATH